MREMRDCASISYILCILDLLRELNDSLCFHLADIIIYQFQGVPVLMNGLGCLLTNITHITLGIVSTAPLHKGCNLFQSQKYQLVRFHQQMM